MNKFSFVCIHAFIIVNLFSLLNADAFITRVDMNQPAVFGFSVKATNKRFHSIHSSPVSSFKVSPWSPSQIQSAQTSTPVSTISSTDFPRISSEDIQTLSTKGYVIIPNFLSSNLVTALREDVKTLRSPTNQKFKVARIGQDSTNALNTDIRIAETCFLGENKMELSQCPNESRDMLYKIMDTLRDDLSGNSILDDYTSPTADNPTPELIQCAPALDTKLTELLYAYYPKGGFYRRHRDAIVGSASILRSYSLLLYINQMEWNTEDGGALRIHLDSGLDFLPPNEEPNFIDVIPNGGTLVLFKSDKIPHEVLDTNAERAAVVGWFNRAVTAADIQNLSSGEGDTIRSAMLLVAAGLITAGLASVILG